MAHADICAVDEHARRRALHVDDATLEQAARMLAAASEPGRLRMLLALARGTANVSALARELGIRVQHASQQLAVLRGARLVRTKRRGKQVEYSLVDDHIHELVRIALALGHSRRTKK